MPPHHVPATHLGLLAVTAALAILLLGEVAILAVRHLLLLQEKTAPSVRPPNRSPTPASVSPPVPGKKKNPLAHFRQPRSGNREPQRVPPKPPATTSVSPNAGSKPPWAPATPGPATSASDPPLTAPVPPHKSSVSAAVHTTPGWELTCPLARTYPLASPNAKFPRIISGDALPGRHLESGRSEHGVDILGGSKRSIVTPLLRLAFPDKELVLEFTNVACQAVKSQKMTKS